MQPVRQSSYDKAPSPAGIGRRRAEQRRPVVHIHRAVRHRSAGQRQDRRIGDAVADNARVRRERGDGRNSRWRRNCHRQGRRRRPGIAGHIGRRRREGVRSIRQRRRRIVQAPLPLATALPNSVAPSNTLTVALASAVPVSVRTFAVVLPSPTVPVSGENEAIVGATRCRRVDRHAQRRRRRPGIAGRIGRRGGQAMRAVR